MKRTETLINDDSKNWVKDIEYNMMNSVDSIMDGIRDVLDDVLKDGGLEARDSIEGGLAPSLDSSWKDIATALSRKFPSGIPTQKLRDIMMDFGCRGCATAKDCNWLKEGRMLEFSYCYCRECLVKSMCTTACPELRNVLYDINSKK